VCANIFNNSNKQCPPHFIPPFKQSVIIHWWYTKIIPLDPILFVLLFSLQIKLSSWKWTFKFPFSEFQNQPLFYSSWTCSKRDIHNYHCQVRLEDFNTIIVSNAPSLKSCNLFWCKSWKRTLKFFDIVAIVC